MLNRTKVAKILQEYAKEVNQSQLLYTISEINKVTIYTHTPGILIGKQGYLVQKYESQLNEIVAQDNVIIKEINLNRENKYKEEYKDVDEEHRPSLKLLPYENVARINFEEVGNSLLDSMYDPMSECM
jgi:hypothetical protein